VPDPVVFRVVRPYQSVDEFLRAEGAWVDLKRMLVVGAEELPPDTLIRFGVDLESGQSLVRAEARVVGYVQPGDTAPGGLHVRFKRYGASTKSFLERAGQFRAEQLGVVPDATPSELLLPVPDVELDSEVANESVRPDSVPIANAGCEPQSGPVQRRPARPVAPPTNREQLLARLRARAKSQQPQIRFRSAPATKAG
jgi:hypothetical protein